jgi:hypothetical protein
MQFTMHGSMQGKDMKETFFLPKDQAYNFASDVTRKSPRSTGFPRLTASIGSVHKHYDLMFEDMCGCS